MTVKPPAPSVRRGPWIMSLMLGASIALALIFLIAWRVSESDAGYCYASLAGSVQESLSRGDEIRLLERQLDEAREQLAIIEEHIQRE